jgi:hypothetical protein
MKDESSQIAALRTKHIIMGSDICRSRIKNYSTKMTQSSTLKLLADLLHLNQIPKVDNACIYNDYYLTHVYRLEFSSYRWWYTWFISSLVYERIRLFASNYY